MTNIVKFREKMRTEDYQLLHPHRTGEKVTIGRQKEGRAYIYLSIELRERLQTESNPYCYIHSKKSKLMLAFTDEAKFPGFRRVRKVIRFPGSLVALWLPKGAKGFVSHHVEDGNLFIDLKELKTNHNRAIRQTTKEKICQS